MVSIDISLSCMFFSFLDDLDGIDQSSNLMIDEPNNKYSPRQEYPVEVTSYTHVESPCDADTIAVRY